MAADTHHPAAATTVPSDPTIPIEPRPSKDSPSPPRPSSSQNFPQRLLNHLRRTLQPLALSTDRTLLRLAKLLSNPASTDALLCTLYYTLELVYAVLSRLLHRHLATFAVPTPTKTTIASEHAVVELFLHLPGETLVSELPVPDNTKFLAQAVGSAKALAGVVGDFRIFVRLWGLLGIYTWARGLWNEAHSSSRRDKILRCVSWAQISSCVGFQLLENGAYLSSKGALTSTGWAGERGKVREGWWWILSSRFWAAHVFLELVRCAVVHLFDDDDYPLDSPPADGDERSVLADGEKEDKLLKEQKKKESWLWKRDFVSNLAYAPLTLHLSAEEGQGILSDWGVGLCGMVAGGALLVDAWMTTG